MKNIAFSVLLFVFASANVMAATTPKIGFVSVEKILTDAPQVEAVNASMLERFGGRKTELQEMEKEGLVNFEKDGRLKLLTLTKKGIEIADHIDRIKTLLLKK